MSCMDCTYWHKESERDPWSGPKPLEPGGFLNTFGFCKRYPEKVKTHCGHLCGEFCMEITDDWMGNSFGSPSLLYHWRVEAEIEREKKKELKTEIKRLKEANKKLRAKAKVSP